jgi:DNA-binding NarL/FixJ family response regulator
MPLVTILIEDSSTIRESLIPALAEVANAKVVAIAETAAEGIAALHAHADSWRLAVVDMFLRNGNGLEVLRAFRTRRPDQHMLVLTNYATSEIRRKALDAGADAVFDKSTEIDVFFDLCQTYSAE